jgi:hypothetical protein
MATYIQGVTDYIPQFQPFEPDYNFYQNIMQTKQSQYDNNWKALNSMYSEYYNADLTREPNIKKRDTYLKDIEFNLKRVSQLDLSLEQNVNQASQIFKPFYEDAALMSDMVKTKKAKSQISLGEGYLSKIDPIQNKKYWSEGVDKIKFELQEFKDATDEEAGNVEISNYTPNRDITAELNKITKDFGNVQFAPEFKNGYIITTTNGEKLVEPLYKLYEASLGDDPGVQDWFRTKAYVDRKRYGVTNAAQFGGDKNKAEMKYLEDKFTVLKDQAVSQYDHLNEVNTNYDAQLLDLEKQKKENKGGPNIDKEIAQLKLNKDINTKVLNRAKTTADIMKETVDADGKFKNPYGDVKSLRWKVDNGMAAALMQKQFLEDANLFALKNMKTDVKVDQYKLADYKNQLESRLVAQRNAATINAARTRANAIVKAANIKAAAEKEAAYGKYLVDTKQGYMTHDPKTGEIAVLPYKNQNQTFSEPKGSLKSGSVTDETNKYYQKMKVDTQMLIGENNAQGVLKNMTHMLNDLVSSNKMSQTEATEILSYSKNKKVTLDAFDKQIKDDKSINWYLTNRIGDNDLKKIVNKFNNYISNHKGDSTFTTFQKDNEPYKQYVAGKLILDDTFRYLDETEKWKIKTSKLIESKIMNELTGENRGNVQYLFDESGNKRTKDEYFAALEKAGRYTYDGRSYWQKAKDMIPGIGRSEGGDYEEYDFFNTRANKLYSDSKFMKNNNGGLRGTGTGIAVDALSSIVVHPNNPVGRTYWGEAMYDLDKFDWQNSKTDRVSFMGYSANAYDKAGSDLKRNDLGLQILNKFRADIDNPKSKFGVVKLTVLPMAGSRSDIGGYILKPDIEWITENTRQLNTDGSVKKSGILSQNQADLMLKNGITYMMKNKEMESQMYKDYFEDPLAANISKGKPYKYEDLTDNDYKFQINKSLGGPSDFTVTGTFPFIDPNTGKKTIETFTESSTVYGNQLTEFRNSLVNGFFPGLKDDYFTTFQQLNSYGIK